MTNQNKYIFWELLDKYSIEIPIIQRDYAQGRKDESRIREGFLKSLLEVIKDESKSINLDFVYGKIIDEKNSEKKLIPLDGQQRLTTLFLLHWYLAIKENKLCKENIERLQKFTYETRISSKEFCNALSTSEIKLADIEKFEKPENQRLSKLIEDQNWFFKSWKKDPTVQSMLNMLDAIHEKFNTVTDGNLFDKLICKNNSSITFDFLNLEEFNLTDELYIKMNARGKPLTKFENFKAEFESYIETAGDNNHVVTQNKAKLDNGWLDRFWKLSQIEAADINEAPKLADEMFYNFFYNMTFNLLLEKQDKYIKINKDKENEKDYSVIKDFIKENNIFSFYKDVYDVNTTKNIIKLLDNVQTDENFKSFVKSIDISQSERAKFYAIYLGYISDIDDVEFSRWKRITFNLIKNERIESPEDLIKTIKSLKKLIVNSNNNIYEYIKENSENIDYFEKNQRDEESLKARLILRKNNENWEDEIKEAEKHWYLDGQIGFLLECSKNNGEEDLKEFTRYRETFEKLWIKKAEGKLPIHGYLIQRALFTFSSNDNNSEPYFYLTEHNKKKRYTLCSFGTGLREKNENWRRVFGDKIFKKLLNKLAKNNIEDSLKKIIDSFEFDFNDWRSLFINPKKDWDILDGITHSQIEIIDKNIYLNRGNTSATSWGWARVAELKSFYIYKYLKQSNFEECLNQKLSLKQDSSKLEYYSISKRDEVCFYFDIYINDKILVSGATCRL